MSLERIARKICSFNLLATNKSLAYDIREALIAKISDLLPIEFETKLYDTNPQGKGYDPGYISFGLKPKLWRENGILGGILIKGTYPNITVKSDSPEVTDPKYKNWRDSGGNKNLSGGAVETADVECGFYIHKDTGSFQNARNLGTITFEVNKFEEIIELEIDQKGTFQSELKSLIKDINDNPPDIAISAGRARANDIFSSRDNYQNHLIRNHINRIPYADLLRLSRRIEVPVTQLEQYFANRGFVIVR